MLVDSEKLGLGAKQRRILEVVQSRGSFHVNELLSGERGECWSDYCGYVRAAIVLRKIGLVDYSRGVVSPINETPGEEYPGASSSAGVMAEVIPYRRLLTF